MKNEREVWYDSAAKVSVTIVDVSDAALALARGHLCGPTAATALARGLAAAALLGSETSEPGETVILQTKCTGPLGGLTVECAANGDLRGYTEKKILDDFDGIAPFSAQKVLGNVRLQVTRSVPGRILSRGLADSLDDYYATSLQRRARIYLEASVDDAVSSIAARGVLVEALPDSALDVTKLDPRGTDGKGSLQVAPRTILSRLGLAQAALKTVSPLQFGCRCSPERALAALAALSPEERASLPPKIDITCHMCGRTWSIPTGNTPSGEEKK